MRKTNFEAVVMGASAGAVESLSAILPKLPANYPLPVIIVVHLPPDKKSVMAELFQGKCQLPVHEADDKDQILNGHIYIAPPDYHLLVEHNKTLSLSYDEPKMFSRPSIDILFDSAADAFGKNLIGIILSGANSDGSEGLKTIANEGGMTIVQNPDKAFAKNMPESAIALCPQAKIMGLNEIINYLEEGIYL